MSGPHSYQPTNQPSSVRTQDGPHGPRRERSSRFHPAQENRRLGRIRRAVQEGRKQEGPQILDPVQGRNHDGISSHFVRETDVAQKGRSFRRTIFRHDNVEVCFQDGTERNFRCTDFSRENRLHGHHGRFRRCKNTRPAIQGPHDGIRQHLGLQVRPKVLQKAKSLN